MSDVIDLLARFVEAVCTSCNATDRAATVGMFNWVAVPAAVAVAEQGTGAPLNAINSVWDMVDVARADTTHEMARRAGDLLSDTIGMSHAPPGSVGGTVDRSIRTFVDFASSASRPTR